MTTRRNTTRNTLQQSQAIVDRRTGLPTQLFIRYFNDNFANIETIINQLNPIALQLTNIDDQLTSAVANSSTAIAIATTQSNKITELEFEVQSLDSFVSELSSKISTNTLDQESANVQISALDEWLTLVEDDLRVAEANINRIDDSLTATIARVAILETTTTDHENRITTLEDEPRLDVALDGVSVETPVYNVDFIGNLVSVSNTQPGAVEVNIRMPSVLDGGEY